MDALADRFLAHLSDERGLSPRTCAAYRRDLERYLDYLDRAGIEPAARARENDVRRFVAGLHRQGLGGRSLSVVELLLQLRAVGWVESACFEAQPERFRLYE